MQRRAARSRPRPVRHFPARISNREHPDDRRTGPRQPRNRRHLGRPARPPRPRRRGGPLPAGLRGTRPPGFAATSDDYVRWLQGEVERLPAPVDLVGHDWGAGHVMRLACQRPDLVRSWTIDIAGCFDSEYIWHDFAQVWQTPGAGEEAVKSMVAAPKADRVAQLTGLGMSKAAAESCAAAANAAMGRCILALYRSAAQPAMTEWGKELPRAAARPGLVIIPTEDHFTGGEPLARRSAARAGAKVAVLEGLGHWWMCQDPKQGAEVLEGFLESLA